MTEKSNVTHPMAERLPENSEFRVMADSAFSAVDIFRKKVGEIKLDRNLSAEGHRAKIAEAANTGPLIYFRELRAQIANERKSLDERRAHFEIPRHDRDDVVAAMDRAEIRAWLRSLEPGERARAACSNPDVAMAVVHSPPELSGLLGDSHDRAKTFLLEHLHGPELAMLRTETEVLENVTAALDVAEFQLRAEYEPQKKGNENVIQAA
jgi:hypothetical protein